MTKIFAVALNLHDHNTYNGVWHNQRERFTRFKHNLPYEVDSYAHQELLNTCLLYTSPSPRDLSTSRMPSSA